MLVKQLNTSLMLKKTNSLCFKKKFVKKIDIDATFCQTNTFFFKDNTNKKTLFFSNVLDIKTDLYHVLKKLKAQKRFFLAENTNSKLLDKYCLNLQTSRLFSSQIELFKKRKAKKLDLNLLIYKNELKKFDKNNLSSLQNSISGSSASILKGYKVYNRHFKYLKIEKQNLLFKILKEKRFIKKIFEGKFFLYSSQKKKKYRSLYKFYEKNKVKIRYFLNIYKLSHLRYIKVKKFSYNLFKKLVWRRKKRKKWRKTALFRFFRSRHRLLYKFYIPKHLEINFKTFNFISYNGLDLSTLNSKIPFWLNLRRLLTFISS